MRGVPRERMAISAAPSWSMGTLHHFGGALDDEAQLVVGVELEAQQDAEARAQRRREQAGARGGGDEGEGPDLHDVGARRGALADDDVELVVLERGVELFFEHGLQAVDLVEEEDLALAQVGEDGGEVALNLQGGAGGLLEADVELVGDDGGERGFAQAGRAEEQHVVERFAAGFGGFERDGELLLGFGLADEFREPAGAELELEGAVLVGARGGDQPFRIVVAALHNPECINRLASSFAEVHARRYRKACRRFALRRAAQRPPGDSCLHPM